MLKLATLDETALDEYLSSTRFDPMTTGNTGMSYSRITNENMTVFTATGRLPAMYGSQPIKQFNNADGTPSNRTKLPFELQSNEIANFAKLETALLKSAAKCSVIAAKETKTPIYQPSVKGEVLDKEQNVKWKGKLAQLFYYFPPTPVTWPTDVKQVKNMEKCTFTYVQESTDAGLALGVGKWMDIPQYALCRVKFTPTIIWKSGAGVGISWKLISLTTIYEAEPPSQPKFAPEAPQFTEDSDEEMEEINALAEQASAGAWTHAAMTKKRKAEGATKKTKKAKKDDEETEAPEPTAEEAEDEE